MFKTIDETPLEDRLKTVYEVVYSYWFLFDKYILPPTIHVYVHRLITEGVLPDLWRDWTWTGMGPYSSSLGYDILKLKQLGLITETCIGSRIRLCGLITLPENPVKPRNLYIAFISSDLNYVNGERVNRLNT